MLAAICESNGGFKTNSMIVEKGEWACGDLKGLR